MSWPTCATCCVTPCVCGTNVPFRHSFPATVAWQPLAPFRLSDEDVERIAKRVVELMAERRAPACQCGDNRREYISPGDEVFLPRVGCTNCNTWDGPPRTR